MSGTVRGDHVFVKRALYTHHGIALGDGRVVHYSGAPGSKVNAQVVVSSLADFLIGGTLGVKVYSMERFSPDEVVERALSRVGEAAYHFAANNCEHFAVWAKTGVAASGQIQRAKRTLFNWIRGRCSLFFRRGR